MSLETVLHRPLEWTGFGKPRSLINCESSIVHAYVPIYLDMELHPQRQNELQKPPHHAVAAITRARESGIDSTTNVDLRVNGKAGVVLPGKNIKQPAPEVKALRSGKMIVRTVKGSRVEPEVFAKANLSVPDNIENNLSEDILTAAQEREHLLGMNSTH